MPGESDSQGAVFGVWVENGDGVSGSPSTDALQEGCGREVALGDHGHQ